MKIIIDCFKQVKGVGKSIGIYNLTLNLIKNLVNYKNKTDDIKIKSAELIILGNKYNRKNFDFPGVKFITITNYDPFNKIHCVVWELFAVSFICRKLNADRIIFPRGFCALIHPIKDTIIIHDLIPFYYDKHFHGVFNKFENAYIMNRLKASIKSCNQIITISEASKKDILKYCKINEQKIIVIHNGCNDMDFYKKSKEQNKPYICAITSGLPHKNANGIFKSYEKYCEITDKPLELKVIGIEDSSCAKLSENVKNKITCFKFIKEDTELYKIIANSKVFMFLSLIEGFGFPPIEAMQLDVPVICSNVSSLPEIVGNAAILVDPENPDEVGKNLKDLIQNEDKQKELIIKGRENIKRFNWDSRAKLYWDAIT